MVYYKHKKSNQDDIIKESQVRLPDEDQETLQNKKTVLQVLKKIGVSYLGEIAWEATLSEYHTKNVLNVLRREDMVERVSVDFHRPDLRLMLRVPDQSAQGQGGFEAFSRKHWFAITDEGRDYLAH